jgi:hypothetical protein
MKLYVNYLLILPAIGGVTVFAMTLALCLASNTPLAALDTGVRMTPVGVIFGLCCGVRMLLRMPDVRADLCRKMIEGFNAWF